MIHVKLAHFLIRLAMNATSVLGATLVAALLLVIIPFAYLYLRVKGDNYPETKPSIYTAFGKQLHGYEDMPDEYLSKLKELKLDIHVSQPDHEYNRITYEITTNNSNSLKVTYCCSLYGFSCIQIDNTDTAFWNTAEYNNLDKYFWISVAALRGNVRMHTGTFTGIHHIWFYLEEEKRWAFTKTTGKHNTHYLTYQKEFPKQTTNYSA